MATGGAAAAPPLNAPSSVLFLTPWYWAALAASICDLCVCLLAAPPRQGSLCGAAAAVRAVSGDATACEFAW